MVIRTVIQVTDADFEFDDNFNSDRGEWPCASSQGLTTLSCFIERSNLERIYSIDGCCHAGKLSLCSGQFDCRGSEWYASTQLFAAAGAKLGSRSNTTRTDHQRRATRNAQCFASGAGF